MANRLKMVKVFSIQELHRAGWSVRRIARVLDVDRATVSRYVHGSNAASDGGPMEAMSEPVGASGTDRESDAQVTEATRFDASLTRSGPPGSFDHPGPVGGPMGASNAATRSELAGAIAPTGDEASARVVVPETTEEITRPEERPRKGSAEACQLPGLCGGAAAHADAGSDPSRPTAPQSRGSRSDCAAFREVIIAKLESGLSLTRIHDDLVEECSARISYYSLRRFVRSLTVARELPFRRMECAPGAEAQIDFGQGPMVTDGKGRRRRTWLFRIVLSFSRRGYSEAVYSQRTDEVIRVLENAFAHFGGVPKVLVPDNMKSAVLVADRFDPDLNPRLRSFCGHYGMVLLPTKPYTPRHKGKVERGIAYVKAAVKGRALHTLADLNAWLIEWELTRADRRVHGTTKEQVLARFERAEKAALGAVPPSRFPVYLEGRRKVSRDGHVEVAKSYYTAPPEYLGRSVWVHWDAHVVRLFNDRMEQIALHTRAEPGRFQTDPRHIVSEKISGVERGAGWLQHRASILGPDAGRWAEQTIATRGVEGMRAVQGLLSLSRTRTSNDINRACRTACSHGAYALRALRSVLKRGAEAGLGHEEQMVLITEHPMIRSLSEYQTLAHAAIQRDPIDPRVAEWAG